LRAEKYMAGKMGPMEFASLIESVRAKMLAKLESNSTLMV
jgi:hypothetical protein